MKRLSVLLGIIILSIFMVEPQLLAVEFQEIRNKFVRANKRIPDRYIVVLKDDAVLFESKGEEPESHLLAVQSITNELIRRHGGVQRHIYSSALKGFSVQMFESQALGLSQDPRVLFVEEAGQVSLAQTTQTNAPWGLDRSDQRDLPRNYTYIYTHNGTGVNVFVIDTGIRYSHQQFGGRAFPAFSVGGENNVDIIGHGTHVAGIIGGSTYGIAKNVRLHSVRVFRNDQQQWTTDDIIAGIDWVAQHHNDAQYGGPDVANLSFELPAADQDANSLDMAVQGLINAGVTCVVAAGNNNTEANMVSPARLPAAITVSATTSGDSRVINFNSQLNPNDCYYPTNYPVNANSGSVVDLFAPGREITSARWDNDTATCELTGTSMSTAFVSGVAAQYLQVNPGAPPAEVQNAIVGSSTPFRLSNVPNGTPNQLLYSNLDNARFVTQTPPPAFMNPGQTAPVSITMKNIGTTTWTAANSYRLGSQNPENNQTWGFGRVELPGSVPPNSQVTFNFTVTAPSAPGVYNFQWRMLKEGELWFGDITPNIPVTVSTSQSPFLGTPIQIPGIIQIENFDNGGEGTAFHDAEPQNLGGQYRTTEGVDITGTADVGGGYIVGWTAPGEWLEYTVNVPIAGTYTLEARVAALNNGGSFHVEFNNSNVTPGGISIPNTGGWDSWITVRKNISLSAGNNQIMRIEMDTGGYYGYVGNINHIRIAQYQGYFDAADCQYALGWAWDRGQPNTPISIDISKDGATPITFPADAFRQDLLNAGIGNGYHGFFFPVPSSWKDGIPHSISVKYSGTTDHLIGSPRTLTCASSGMPVNVALASNGGVGTASSTINSNYPAAAANNGDRKGLNWGAGGGWNDATAGVFPDWIQVDFNGTKTINEIDVFTLQDNFSNPVEPTPTLTFSYYGITAFNVQYWNSSAWVTIPGGTVTGNNLVWRKFTFSNISTSKIRVLINNALNSYSRVVEVEAYSPVNVARSSNGGVVTASSTINSNYPTVAANNGDRKGLNWGAGGGWNDATSGVFPDWIQVDFNGTKTINEIDVFTLQDNFANPVEPTPTMTFTLYGITAFSVQYWNGSVWVTIPGGSITGNNLVWRRFTFSNIATSKIRVLINNALNSYSRVVELEAYSQ